MSIFSRVKQFPRLIANNLISPKVQVYTGRRVENSKIGIYPYISYLSFVNQENIGCHCSTGQSFRSDLGMYLTNFLFTSSVFYSSNFPIGNQIFSFNEFPGNAPVSIGNDIWIGSNFTQISLQ